MIVYMICTRLSVNVDSKYKDKDKQRNENKRLMRKQIKHTKNTEYGKEGKIVSGMSPG